MKRGFSLSGILRLRFFWLQHVLQSNEDRFIYTSPNNDQVSEKDMHVHFTFSPGIGDHHRNNSFEGE